VATVSELLSANLHGVFGTRDAASRRETAERIYAADVVFTDPEESVQGREALLAKAESLQAGAPAEFVLAEDGDRYASETTGALAWAFGPEGAPVARGIDVLKVQGGVIVSIETFFAVTDPA
jgi:hypothetical protein